MNLPALYHKSHKANKQDVGEIIRHYVSNRLWRFRNGATLLDVGSGPGDVLVNYIYPLMPSNFGKIICSDISKDMVEYAKGLYGNIEKLEFKVLDIAAELPVELIGQMDHVSSMLCLHWVQDHRFGFEKIFRKVYNKYNNSIYCRYALQNIYKLLRNSGGDCLLVFMSSHNIFHAYRYISRETKWSEYVKDVQRFISPLHDSANAKAEFRQMMKEVGFVDVSVELKKRTFSYGSVANFKGD